MNHSSPQGGVGCDKSLDALEEKPNAKKNSMDTEGLFVAYRCSFGCCWSLFIYSRANADSVLFAMYSPYVNLPIDVGGGIKECQATAVCRFVFMKKEAPSCGCPQNGEESGFVFVPEKHIG